ncbi:tryptophan halogenase family protein [uncultured Gilvimarinus sp.]|uniref:tryptophan halogenase family protein n=1 Tax=uncultured Gilvimarinus sp. TaxID=1689143 RepID=UPI0030DA39AE
MAKFNVVIAGGGSAGWMAAAMLARLLGPQLNLTLVESSEIATVGVGEATIPPIQAFNQVLGIDEAEFLRATGGTIKLAIEFNGWTSSASSYLHAFGSFGREQGFASFYHYWHRAQAEGLAGDFWQYSLNARAARAGKFAPLDQIANTPLPGLNYAYHFDAGRYAELLKSYCKKAGVTHIDATINRVQLDADQGHIKALQLTGGQTLSGDFFIDCTGGRSLLLGDALGVAFDDYLQWLPCNRAIALPSERLTQLQPFTRSSAHRAGWCWQIPLAHRTGNGIVFNADVMTNEQALAVLQQQLAGPATGEPKTIHFKVGRRRQQWHKNCVALGLASGFLEPLESTSLHLVQSAITRLVKLFPCGAINTHDVTEFNRQAQTEFESIRDFIILHYHLNGRSEPFWRECQTMAIPDALVHRIALFKASGRVFTDAGELFTEPAWQQVMLGQGIKPEAYHTLADGLSSSQLGEFMSHLDTIYGRTVNQLASHEEFLRSVQKASA